MEYEGYMDIENGGHKLNEEAGISTTQELLIKSTVM